MIEGVDWVAGQHSSGKKSVAKWVILLVSWDKPSTIDLSKAVMLETTLHTESVDTMLLVKIFDYCAHSQTVFFYLNSMSLGGGKSTALNSAVNAAVDAVNTVIVKFSPHRNHLTPCPSLLYLSA